MENIIMAQAQMTTNPATLIKQGYKERKMFYYIVSNDMKIAKFVYENDRNICLDAFEKKYPEDSFLKEKGE